MNKRRKFLFASVLAVQNWNFIYPSCQRCFSKIILESKRFTCPKCGSSGDTGSTNYRYKLSLKVAESSKLFFITVFGSCLDTFFGLTATGLHRYLEDSIKNLETLDSGRTQSLLTTAVEKCFVGQSFVFGVTNFGDVCGHDSDSSNFQQPCCKLRGEVRTLVASQIILPSPHVKGFTVIAYLHPLLHKKPHCGSQEHSSQSLTSDDSDSDLNNIQGSGNTSWFSESSVGEDFFRFWEPSLELTSSDSQVTSSDDFPASKQIMASGTPNQNRHCISVSEVTSSKNCHDSLQSLWSLHSCMDKNNTTGKLGEELGLPSPVCNSCHESRLSDSHFFPSQMQEPFEEHNLECYSKAGKDDYSQYDIACYQHYEVNTTPILQQRSSAFSLSSLKPEETANPSQNSDSLIWDDLPLSESLNKFLAVVESEVAVTEIDAKNRKQGMDKSIDKCHKNYSRLSLTPWRNTRALNTSCFSLRSSQAMMKDSGKEALFSNCKSNSSPHIQKESKADKTEAAVSIAGSRSDISEDFLPDTCSSALFTSSKDREAFITQKRTSGVLQQKNEISCRPSTSISDCSDLRSRYFTGCGQKLHSGTKGKLAIQNCSKKYSDASDLHKLENKHRWPKKEDDNFTICRKLTYPLETLCSSPESINTSKEMPCRPSNNNLTPSSSGDHEGSYNASADLFDYIANDKDIGTEITKIPQDNLLPLEVPCTENYPINENRGQPSQKLSLQSISPSRYSRPRSQSDSECDFEESQDFVPCSQSTPVAGFHQRIHGLNGASKILPSIYSNPNANYKNRKNSPLTGQYEATSACSKNVKAFRQKPESPFVSSLTQANVFNHCPAAESLGNDVDEWVPPTTKKVFISDILGFRVMGLRKCLDLHYSPDPKELPRKKLIKVTHKTNI